MNIDLVVPTFKETSDPIEEIIQMHTDDATESDYSLIDTEPLDIYSRQELFDEDIQDMVYGTNEEFNALFYDIENDLDDEVSDKQVPNQASISKSVISTCVCTQQNTQSMCLAQVNGKVKRMWVKALFRSEPKVILSFIGWELASIQQESSKRAELKKTQNNPHPKVLFNTILRKFCPTQY